MKPKRTSYRSARDWDGDGSAKGVDGGWAWMVCLAAHLGQMLTCGYLASLGVFYLEWKEYFDSSATVSSWLVSLPWLAASPVSFIIGILAPRLSIRRVSVVGAALNGFATLLGSFASELWQLYLCGILSGIAMSMILPTGYIIITQYFKKRYALANGICLLGTSFGQTVFPPLIRLLIANYGWRGAMFIIGALQMNGVAACALFRPFKVKSSKDTLRHSNLEMEELKREEIAGEEMLGIKQIRTKEHRGYAVCLTIFTNIPFVLSLPVIIFYSMGWITNLVHLPARAKAAGWSEDQCAMLLTIFAIFAMLTRVTHGWLVDRKYIGIYKLQFGVLTGAALLTLLNPASDSYVFLAVNAVLLGACLGITTPLLIVIVRKLVKKEDIPFAMSLVAALCSLFNGTGSVIAGKIFDMTGTYVVTFLAAGGFFVASSALLGVVLILKRKQEGLSPGEAVANASEDV